MTPLTSSPYSYHFLALRLLGGWVYFKEDKEEVRGNDAKVNAYAFYRLFGTGLCVYAFLILLLDFYLVAGDMKKMTWNLCVTCLLIGMMFKNSVMVHHHERINRLRWRLHRDAESRRSPEHVSVNDAALKEMKFIRVAFYVAAILFMPAWIISRYHDHELPIPFVLPWYFDLDIPSHFHFVFFCLGVGATVGMMITMESELAMYSLLVQISREYRILLMEIYEMNELYVGEDEREEEKKEEEMEEVEGRRSVRNSRTEVRRKEVNPLLRMMETKLMLKRFSERQEMLIRYTEVFEATFNKPLLQQFFGMSVLIVVLALQLLWESVDFSANFYYQMGYLYINIMDMFMMCWFSTRLRSQCLDVGETFYSTLWYRMSAEIQRDITMMIMRSQRPPKITTGKFMELNLQTFLSTMSHLYSWLALIRQFE